MIHLTFPKVYVIKHYDTPAGHSCPHKKHAGPLHHTARNSTTTTASQGADKQGHKFVPLNKGLNPKHGFQQSVMSLNDSSSL